MLHFARRKAVTAVPQRQRRHRDAALPAQRQVKWVDCVLSDVLNLM
jgi:hypothetical protein